MFDGEVAVVGHICLDVIPTFITATRQALQPGALVQVGPVRFSPGGTVANVGLALHRLGCRPQLVSKIGDDHFGMTLLDLLRAYDTRLVEGMRVTPGETTSYSVVINPPGIDRTFLHCSGANDRFGAEDVAAIDWAGVRVLHFGYPPLMARIAANDGAELNTLLATAHTHGVTTSLDMAWPDPESAAGHIDWSAFLRHCLPQVDLFMPSAEELVFLLGDGTAGGQWSLTQLDALAERCLGMGAAIVAVKLGERGLLLRTTDDAQRLRMAGAAVAAQAPRWRGRHLLAPCFAAKVAGTTGAGDATIAGFLLALLADAEPIAALTSAVAVGGCSVEAPDATSGIPRWETVQARIAAGWPRLPLEDLAAEWQWEAALGIWHGPHDQRGAGI